MLSWWCQKRIYRKRFILKSPETELPHGRDEQGGFTMVQKTLKNAPGVSEHFSPIQLWIIWIKPGKDEPYQKCFLSQRRNFLSLLNSYNSFSSGVKKPHCLKIRNTSGHHDPVNMNNLKSSALLFLHNPEVFVFDFVHRICLSN